MLLGGILLPRRALLPRRVLLLGGEGRLAGVGKLAGRLAEVLEEQERAYAELKVRVRDRIAMDQQQQRSHCLEPSAVVADEDVDAVNLVGDAVRLIAGKRG